MKPSRTTRLVAAVIAVISLLFTQLALASYVCPGMAVPESMTVAVDDGMAGMDHCSDMDMAQPGLCHAYGHAGQQSLDKPDLPQVPPFHAIGPALTVVVLEAATPPPTAVAAMPSLAHATAPPLAIRHCCLRI
ncbi:hypothetical protein EGT07_23560 [Herbaspirillum sp. HC18]|nr:hypothetical protein EGT07_23560 [Herbaspirillum sp. HC18]